ncbi:hypothetical protein JTE90_022587 [Oedothorax gibbosus]|uniref:Uncharacterized protein n=1 Tax=Oedothorax gibbosus TaxID=931172 RepID=A0AAV6TRG0_9ARAC|nr:hypothetical protein JTE90_022587 [Oedothorax gibbosus]
MCLIVPRSLALIGLSYWRLHSFKVLQLYETFVASGYLIARPFNVRGTSTLACIDSDFARATVSYSSSKSSPMLVVDKELFRFEWMKQVLRQQKDLNSPRKAKIDPRNFFKSRKESQV